MKATMTCHSGEDVGGEQVSGKKAVEEFEKVKAAEEGEALARRRQCGMHWPTTERQPAGYGHLRGVHCTRNADAQAGTTLLCARCRDLQIAAAAFCDMQSRHDVEYNDIAQYVLAANVSGKTTSLRSLDSLEDILDEAVDAPDPDEFVDEDDDCES